MLNLLGEMRLAKFRGKDRTKDMAFRKAAVRHFSSVMIIRDFKRSQGEDYPPEV